MSENVYTLKCEKCSANLRYNVDEQFWICEYCGSEYQASDFENKLGKYKYSYKYICKDCGAEIIIGENTSATSCVYCGNTAILLDRITDIAEPKKIITFKINKENAVKKLKKYAKIRSLMDKHFINSLEDINVEGVYTPFWIYAGNIFGDKKFGRYESVSIEYEGELNKVNIDGIKSLANDEIIRVEPYNFKECEMFRKEYLSGFLADRYDFDAQSGVELINENIQQKLNQKCKGRVLIFSLVLIIILLVVLCISVTYASLQINYMHINWQKLLLSSACSLISIIFLWLFVKGMPFLSLKNNRFFYIMGEKELVLLPLYIIKTRTNKKEYISLMNGQTGKIFCKLGKKKVFCRNIFSEKSLKIKLKMKINVLHFILDLVEECKRKYNVKRRN